MAWEKYWERNGTRRPFPSLYEAIKAYGEDRVYYDQPQYVEDGYCKWCGKKIENKRRKSFCCDECSQKFARFTVWQRGRDAYSLRILYRDNFTCRDCGEFKAYKNEHGVYIPIDSGLEVHHIIPVSEGGNDDPDNLITLCHDCHMKRHHGNKEKENDKNN